jgi:hypothetical protein
MIRLNRNTFSLFLLNLLLALAFAVSKSQAGGPPIDGFSFYLQAVCQDGIIWVYDYNPLGIPSVYFDVNVAPYASTTISANEGNGYTGSLSYSPLAPGTIFNVEFRDEFNHNANQLVTVSNCLLVDPAVPNSGNESPIAQTPPCHTDGRLDPLNCAAPVALYLSSDAEGWMLQIWAITEESEGQFLLVYYQSDLPEAGSEPLLLAELDNVALYLLPTWELQVNAPYLAEPSKTYVFIFEVPGGIGYHHDIES